MTRLRHRPDHFTWRGDEYDFHRHQDGASLPCLDRNTTKEQEWPLHSGRVIYPTGEEVRAIIWQVHGIRVEGEFEDVAEAPPAPAPTPDAPPPPPEGGQEPDRIPPELERFKLEGESIEDFRLRAFKLLFRLGMDEGEHFADAPPLSKQERIDLVPMLVANFKAGNWLSLDDSIKDARVPMSPNDEDALKGPA